mmetsp:Transcript_19113/g.58912  ORF Transcript_19113/g.58912 Transcript_19113/m.58912 type:complete len:235 (-) Transcript_19113:393-1097(-)
MRSCCAWSWAVSVSFSCSRDLSRSFSFFNERTSVSNSATRRIQPVGSHWCRGCSAGSKDVFCSSGCRNDGSVVANAASGCCCCCCCAAAAQPATRACCRVCCVRRLRSKISRASSSSRMSWAPFLCTSGSKSSRPLRKCWCSKHTSFASRRDVGTLWNWYMFSKRVKELKLRCRKNLGHTSVANRSAALITICDPSSLHAMISGSHTRSSVNSVRTNPATSSGGCATTHDDRCF